MSDRQRWGYLTLSCGLYWFAHSMTRPIIALYASSWGATEFQIGILLGFFALFPMIIAIPCGGLATSIGKIKLLRMGTLLMAASGVIYLLSNAFWMMMFAQLLAGVGQLFVWLIIQMLVTENKSPSLQHKRISSFSLSMTVGQLGGPLLGGVISDQFGFKLTFLIYFIFSCMIILISWLFTAESQKIKVESTGYFRESFALLKNIGFVSTLLTTFIILFILDIRTAFFPVYLDSIHFSATQIGLLLSLGGSSALFVKPIYPILVKKLGYLKLLMLTFVFSLSLLFFIPIISSFASMFIVIFLSGLALSINQPLSLTLIADQTTLEQRGIAVGMRLMANRTAQLFDPVIFGVVASFFSVRLAFFIIGCGLAFLSTLSIWLFHSSLFHTKPVQGKVHTK